ncbi:MAG: GNAT family N-acetyltransferase [Prevotella sp.]|nr:GNAT family N-acetyltransferase [Prevotella sp.]
MNKTLPTVRLRAMEPEDLELLYTIENDMNIWGVSATNVPYSHYVLHDYMAQVTGDIYTDKQVRLVIENDDKAVVGLVDLVNFDPKNNRVELGLIIQKPFRRQGYSEATMLMLHNYASAVLHLHQIYAVIAVANKPSLMLFKKLGYHQSEELKDWLFDGKTYQSAVIVNKIL